MTDQLSYAEKFAATGKHKICADAVTAICRVLSLKIHSLSNLPASILCNTAPETSFAWHEDKKHWQYKLVFLIGEVSFVSLQDRNRGWKTYWRVCRKERL
jgi:hypothetical protein